MVLLDLADDGFALGFITFESDYLLLGGRKVVFCIRLSWKVPDEEPNQSLSLFIVFFLLSAIYHPRTA